MGKGEKGRRRRRSGGGDPQGRAGKEDTKEQGSGGERNNNNKVCKQDSPSPSRNEIHQGLSGPSERLISHVASVLLSRAPAEWDQAAQVKTGRETPVPRGQGLRPRSPRRGRAAPLSFRIPGRGFEHEARRGKGGRKGVGPEGGEGTFFPVSALPWLLSLL